MFADPPATITTNTTKPLLRQVIIDKGKVIKRYKKKDEEKQVFPDYHIIFLSWLMDLKFQNPICVTKYQSTIHYKKNIWFCRKHTATAALKDIKDILSCHHNPEWMNAIYYNVNSPTTYCDHLTSYLNWIFPKYREIEH